MSGEDGGDCAAVGRLWQDFVATGRIEGGEAVRERLVRQVVRVPLPTMVVYCKAMAFPRWKDRLRYAFRALPAEREAAMLERVRKASVPCPVVVAVRTLRRGLLPSRSLLVLRALDTGAERERDPHLRLLARARLAARLADAGLLHPDLNPDNFVPLADGSLAVIDVQSMRTSDDANASKRAMAARLLAETADLAPERARDALAEAGLVPAGDAGVLREAASMSAAWLRSRARRCLQTSTEFERRAGLLAVEHAHRGPRPEGRWLVGGPELLEAWLGQRVRFLVDGQAPPFAALRRPRGPFGAHALWVPSALDEVAARAAIAAAAAARRQHAWWLGEGEAPSLVELQRLRERLRVSAG